MPRRLSSNRSIPSLALAAVFAAAATSPAWAQSAKPVSPVIKINQAAATDPIETTALRGSLSMLSGSGGNITVLAGKQGKLLVDAGIAVSRPRLEAALDALGKTPI